MMSSMMTSKLASSLLVFFALLGGTVPAYAFSPKCFFNVTSCVSVQGKSMPISDAEAMVEDCRDFTRRNIGARVLRMSLKEIMDASSGSPIHPLFLAYSAYGSLHDSPLDFNRDLPIEQRYAGVKRACGQVFRDMRVLPPSDD